MGQLKRCTTCQKGGGIPVSPLFRLPALLSDCLTERRDTDKTNRPKEHVSHRLIKSYPQNTSAVK